MGKNSVEKLCANKSVDADLTLEDPTSARLVVGLLTPDDCNRIAFSSFGRLALGKIYRGQWLKE